MDLNDAQIERYSRQIILPAIGGRGQQRLLSTTVSVVGDGPLAATAARYLTAAGVGALEVWATTDSGAGEMQATQQDLTAFNPDTTIRLRRLTPQRAEFAQTAVFLCGNVTTMVLEAINRAALSQRVPLVAGSADGGAKIALYAGHHAEWPCAECDTEPPVGAEHVLRADAASGFIGSVMALAAIQSCLGLAGSRPGRALHFDPETLRISEYPIGKRATCRACGVADA